MSLRVGVIAYQETQARQIRGRLKRMGYEITSAVSSTTEGLCDAEASRPQVVLLDLRSRGKLNAIRVAKRLQEMSMPVAFLAGPSRQVLTTRSERSLAYAVAFEPFAAPELRVAIELTFSRFQTEQRLKGSEELCTQILHRQVSFSCLCDLNASMIFVNEAMAQWVGRSRDELIGGNFLLLLPRRDREMARDLLSILSLKEPAVTFECPVHHPTTGERWTRWRMLGIFGPDGLLVSIQIEGLDMTESRHLLLALKGSEESLKSVVDALPLGMHKYEVGPDNQLIFAGFNPAADHILGLDHSRLLGLPIGEAFPALKNSETSRRFLDAALSGKSWRTEAVISQEQEVQSAREVYAFQTAPGQMAAAFLDITPRKRAEAERERLLLKLEEKNQEKEQLLFVVSHDLKSPLVNIHGFAQELGRILRQLSTLASPLDSSQDSSEALGSFLSRELPMALECLTYIDHSIARMDAILSGLLRLSRVGRSTFNVRPLDVNKLVAEAIEGLSYRMKETQASLQCSPLPGCLGDEILLGLIFSNLIDNALKFLDPSRPVRIEISGRRDGPHVRYAVKDNGIGIAAEHLQSIFELFMRLRPDRVSGEGLGLTLCRKIADHHGGRIWAESKQGQGSIFYLELPSGDSA